MSRLALLPTTRRGKWVALVVWLLLLVVGGMVAGRLAEVQQNDTESFLPAAAESVQVIELQQEAGSDALPAVVLYERAGGLSPADLAAVAADAEAGSAAAEEPVEAGSVDQPDTLPDQGAEVDAAEADPSDEAAGTTPVTSTEGTTEDKA